MQQRISTRDDWTFIAEDTTFISVCREPFATADEVSQRISDVLAIVAALPTSVAPAQVDHSADDLLARIAHIDTFEQALVFLQQLSDADRQRLAASPTPLAKFADVRTPDDAIARDGVARDGTTAAARDVPESWRRLNCCRADVKG